MGKFEQEHEGSYATGKEPCPACRAKGEDTSGDNLIRYSDGHGYCFACKHYVRADGTEPQQPKLREAPSNWKSIAGEIMAIPERRIREEIARLYNYRIATNRTNGQQVHVENFYRDGELVAQHLRFPDKEFRWIGNAKQVPLFGQHLWKMGGRRLIITEGAIDCLSVAQVQDGKWPVVSLPMGAGGAVKAIKDNYAFVASYQEIVLCFDNDEAGQKAAKDCADILPPGKVKIVRTPRKDANEHLKANDTKALMTALWEAQVYRPDGILHASEIRTEEAVDQEVWEYPFDQLTNFLVGQRAGEMTMWTSGTGSGKSTIIRELVAHHLKEGRAVGMLMLEEAPKETVDDLVSLHLGKPVRQIKAMRKLNALRVKLGKKPLDSGLVDDLTDEEYAEARQKINNTGLYIYDHYGSTDYGNLVARVEYMAVSLGVKVVVLDHVTAAVAGMMGDEFNDERKMIDAFMKDLRSLVERTGIHLDIVSQLRKSDGKGWEEGEPITVQALRGSGSLGTVPNTIIAMERNRQDPDPLRANTSIMRVLKNRFTGRSGIAAALRYDMDTGRTHQVAFNVDPEGNVVFSDNSPEVNPGDDGTEPPNVFEDEANKTEPVAAV
jgi:twinkle protein